MVSAAVAPSPGSSSPLGLRLRQPRNAPPPAVSVVPQAPVRDGLAGLAPRCRCRPGVCPTGCGTERSARPLLSDTGADPRPSDLIWAARNRSRCCVIEILRRKGGWSLRESVVDSPRPRGLECVLDSRGQGQLGAGHAGSGKARVLAAPGPGPSEATPSTARYPEAPAGPQGSIFCGLRSFCLLLPGHSHSES